jgi:hypothetical protein
MNVAQIALDSLMGVFLFGGISFFSQSYDKKIHYIRIIAFLWGAPAAFFYFLIITARVGKPAMYEFTNHALVGILFTLVAFCITYLLEPYSIETIIFINFLFAVLVLAGYFHSRMFTREIF